jgi:hypothetical protein
MTSVLIRILLAMPGTANDLPPAHALSDVHRIYVDSIYFRPLPWCLIGSTRTRMPAYVLKCEGCARFGSFLIHEGQLPEAWKKQPIQRHCGTKRNSAVLEMGS